MVKRLFVAGGALYWTDRRGRTYPIWFIEDADDLADLTLRLNALYAAFDRREKAPEPVSSSSQWSAAAYNIFCGDTVIGAAPNSEGARAIAAAHNAALRDVESRQKAPATPRRYTASEIDRMRGVVQRSVGLPTMPLHMRDRIYNSLWKTAEEVLRTYMWASVEPDDLAAHLDGVAAKD